MEPKCAYVVSPGSVDTVSAYSGISPAGAEVSQLTKEVSCHITLNRNA